VAFEISNGIKWREYDAVVLFKSRAHIPVEVFKFCRRFAILSNGLADLADSKLPSQIRELPIQAVNHPAIQNNS
jgi:hypothetical protein